VAEEKKFQPKLLEHRSSVLGAVETCTKATCPSVLFSRRYIEGGKAMTEKNWGKQFQKKRDRPYLASARERIREESHWCSCGGHEMGRPPVRGRIPPTGGQDSTESAKNPGVVRAEVFPKSGMLKDLRGPFS